MCHQAGTVTADTLITNFCVHVRAQVKIYAGRSIHRMIKGHRQHIELAPSENLISSLNRKQKQQVGVKNVFN